MIIFLFDFFFWKATATNFVLKLLDTSEDIYNINSRFNCGNLSEFFFHRILFSLCFAIGFIIHTIVFDVLLLLHTKIYNYQIKMRYILDNAVCFKEEKTKIHSLHKTILAL